MELSRSRNLNLPSPPSLIPTILKNLQTLQSGLSQLSNSTETVELRSQETRILDLLESLGILEPRQAEERLVDTDDE